MIKAIYKWMKEKIDIVEDYFTSGTVNYVLFAIGLVAGLVLFLGYSTEIDQLKILNKVFNLGMVLGIVYFLIRYLGGKKTNVEKLLLGSPEAISRLLGALAIAVSIAIAYGG
jgi:hypothetical protein